MDSKTDYLYDTIIDPGKNNKNFIITNPEYSYTESVVVKLLSKHENKGYIIFFDSWYSSISLINILTKKGFRAISTLRLNAKNFLDKTSLENSSKKYGYNNEYHTIIQQYPIKKKNIFFISNFYEPIEKRKKILCYREEGCR